MPGDFNNDFNADFGSDDEDTIPLIDRLLGNRGAKIPVHSFVGAIAENARGAPGMTTADIVFKFNLTALQESQLLGWLAAITPFDPLFRQQVEDALNLGEGELYTKQEVRDRLGVT